MTCIVFHLPWRDDDDGDDDDDDDDDDYDDDDDDIMMLYNQVRVSVSKWYH